MKLKSDSSSSESISEESSVVTWFSCSVSLEGDAEDEDIGRRLPGIRASNEETGEECTEDVEDAGPELDVLSGTEEQVTGCLMRVSSFLLRSFISEESFISISFRF